MAEVEALIFLADKRVNALMKKADLAQRKVYCSSYYNIYYETSSFPDDKYFEGLIQSSKKSSDDEYIAIIFANGGVYSEEDINIFSYKNKEVFFKDLNGQVFGNALPKEFFEI